MTADRAMLQARGLAKTFTLHQQGGIRLPVFADVDLTVHAGECVALTGRSGSGKSSLLRCLYGNYGASAGTIDLWHARSWVSLTTASDRTVLELRRRTLAHVSQFLRVVPRVAVLDIVAEPLRALGVAAADAQRRAGAWLERLGIPARLWELPPATFSGGEQQRVNIARGLVSAAPILLLDEPTASLDAANRRAVVAAVREAREAGAAIVGIFHDEEVRAALASRCFDVEACAVA